MRRAAVTFACVLAASAVSSAPASGQAYTIPGDNPFMGRAGARAEIYSYGLRNPWRFTFDRATGDMLIPDVGQGASEELNFVPNGQGRGANFGWACREGSGPGPKTGCSGPFFEPFYDYPTSSPGAVVGGYVVRAPDLPGLAGRYLYADFYDSAVRSIVPGNGGSDQDTGANVTMLSSFGEAPDGRLFAASLTGGGVYKLNPAGGSGLSASQIGSFSSPIHLAAAPGDNGRLFVAERSGRIKILTLPGGPALSEPFLDISSQVRTTGEGGLLSMAFAPDYAASGRLYVFFIDSNRNIRIDEFQRSCTDPSKAGATTQRQVLLIPHPGEDNHYGGQLQFGPDGLLYVSTGDGGGGNDEHNHAQNLGTLLGKVIRIDPRSGPAACGSDGGGSGGGGGAVVRDSRAPTLRLRVAKRQRLARTKSVIAYARTTEVGRLKGTGRLVIGNASKSYKLRSTARRATPGRRYKLRLKLSRRQVRMVSRALRGRRRVRATLRLSATDAAGNSRAARRRVRARR